MKRQGDNVDLHLASDMVAFVRGRARIKPFGIVYYMILEHRTLIASI